MRSALAPPSMDPAETPPRGDDVDEPEEEVPLSDRMAKFQEELRAARGLLDKVTPGYPKLISPVSIAEAFHLADAAQAAKAKENVSARVIASHTATLPSVFSFGSALACRCRSSSSGGRGMRTGRTHQHISP